jgi:hypothetical protein
VAVLAVALLFYPIQALTLRPARGAGWIWVYPIASGAEFQLQWTHTVTRRPIIETYRVQPDRQLALVQMIFDQYGPNLPAGPEGGTTWRIERDRWVVTGYQVELAALGFGVGPYGHELQVGSRRLDLLRAAGSDRLLKLSVERQPLLLIILTEVWQWRHTRALR